MVRQFVVQLDGRPGELARIVRSFEAFNVQLQHVSCVGSPPLECMFVTTTDDDAARGVIRGLGHPFVEGEPLLVEIPDRPDAFAALTDRLAAAGVRVTGVVRAGERSGAVEMVVCVDDAPAARAALGQKTEDLVGVGG